MGNIDAATNSSVSGTVERRWIFGKRQLLIGIGVAAIAAGAVLKWDWLVAIGGAPVILSVLPCLAMCALGFCAMRGGRQSCRGSSDTGQGGNGPGSRQALPHPEKTP